MTKLIKYLPTLLLLFTATINAYEVRLDEEQLQQELDARMPLTQQQGIFTLTLSEPQLTLLGDVQRARIRTNALLLTSFGLQSRGQLTMNGKIRYDKTTFSFFIDEPQVTQVSIDGLASTLEPQLIALAQQAIEPALKNQAVYTLSDQDMTQALARMMLKSLTIDGTQVVLIMSPF